MALAYTPGELPENTFSLSIAYYDANEGWIELETSCPGINEAGAATARVSHFTFFALLAKPTPAAKFKISNMSISAAQVQPDQEITISIKVANTGGVAGNYDAVLRINGQVQQSKAVSVGPGAACPVKFTMCRSQQGTYAVTIDGQRASFTVTDNALIAVIASFVLVVLAGMLLIYVRWRAQAG